MDLVLNSRDFLEVAESILKKGKGFSFKAIGHSMAPFIKDGDIVTVRPITRPLKVGDVVLLKTNEGKPLLHRVKKIDKEWIITKGDASYTDDPPLPKENILALAVNNKGKGYNFHFRYPFGYIITLIPYWIRQNRLLTKVCKPILFLLRLII